MKLKQYKLPIYWASALVNGDESGLSGNDSAHIEAFLQREDLTLWSCVSMSDDTWFSHSNDATSLGGDVAIFTFCKH